MNSLVIGHSSLVIPSYPARPINGGALEHAGPKIGRWFVEPKYNGWRALVHVPTGAMFNRHGKRLTIEKEFASALNVLRDCCGNIVEWLDCEALERRHGIGRGTLIVFDFLPLSDRSFTYEERRHHLGDLPVLPITEQPAHHHACLAPAWEEGGRPRRHGTGNAESLWHDLPEINRTWNTTGLSEFYEGIVMKRADSPYPMQFRSADTETPHWMKHRWMPTNVSPC